MCRINRALEGVLPRIEGEFARNVRVLRAGLRRSSLDFQQIGGLLYGSGRLSRCYDGKQRNDARGGDSSADISSLFCHSFVGASISLWKDTTGSIRSRARVLVQVLQ